MKTILLSIIFAISISAYGADATKNSFWNWNDSKSPAEQAIASANYENKKAKVAGFEWRDTKKIIKKATKLAKKDAKKAIKLANKAKRQALNAQTQAFEQRNAGPRF